MDSTVWVGRVKSTCPAKLLESAFSKVGRVAKVETGFAGFAFVEFEDADDVEKACKVLNKAHIEHVGEVRVSKATDRGYKDACVKRDEYLRARGKRPEPSHTRSTTAIAPWRDRTRESPRGRTRDSRSRSPRRVGRMSKSRSRSSSSRHRSSSDTSDFKRAKSKSRASRAPRRSPTPTRATCQPKPRDIDRMHSHSAERQQHREVSTADAAAGEDTSRRTPLSGELIVKKEIVEIAPADRAAAVCFFDGSNATELLLESSAVVRVPDSIAPNLVNGYPHGFPDISQENAMRLLHVLAAFMSEGGAEVKDVAEEKSVEIRQAFIVDDRGRRCMQKKLLINGTCVCEDEKSL